MRYLLIGCGYTGERIAPRLRGRVEAFTGSEASAARLRARGIEAQAWDLDRPVPGDHGLEVTDAAILYLAPPPPGGETDPRLRTFLAALDGRPARLVYLSTTGVYGDAQGATVTEDTPPNPSTGRARARLDAEAALRAWCGRQDVEWTILRVPGIYGPGRLGTESIRDAVPVIRDEDANPGNRIHVDDLATCCIAALSPDVPDGIYNVGDGDHRSGTWFTGEVARQAGLPPPPAISLAAAQQTFSPMRLSFLRESRVVDTTKMREVLGVIPKYANAADGIAASLREESRPG